MAPQLPLNPSYNPSAVMLGNFQGGPYLKTDPIRRVNEGGTTTSTPSTPAPQPSPNPNPNSTTLGAESIRSTGSGPFDSAYRQNLATFAGGQFSRPGGSMNFNPTDPSTFPGNPTGGGNAPITGLPTSLLDNAIGGQGFSWTPPATDPNATSGSGQQTPNILNLQDWIKRFLLNGNYQRQSAQ